jgi:hypothetical protein
VAVAGIEEFVQFFVGTDAGHGNFINLIRPCIVRGFIFIDMALGQNLTLATGLPLNPGITDIN